MGGGCGEHCKTAREQAMYTHTLFHSCTMCSGPRTESGPAVHVHIN